MPKDMLSTIAQNIQVQMMCVELNGLTSTASFAINRSLQITLIAAPKHVRFAVDLIAQTAIASSNMKMVARYGFKSLPDSIHSRINGRIRRLLVSAVSPASRLRVLELPR